MDEHTHTVAPDTRDASLHLSKDVRATLKASAEHSLRVAQICSFRRDESSPPSVLPDPTQAAERWPHAYLCLLSQIEDMETLLESIRNNRHALLAFLMTNCDEKTRDWLAFMLLGIKPSRCDYIAGFSEDVTPVEGAPDAALAPSR